MAQFCPIAKASEVVCERWTLLIMREIIMGGTRFNVLQRGLGNISPTILTKRLKVLDEQGLIVRRKIPGQKGFEYFPSECGRELMPILIEIGKWGMRWARESVADQDIDLDLLMLYIERSIDRDHLIGNETVIRFHFVDLSKYDRWWLIVTPDSIESCVQDPGREVDVYFTVDLPTMVGLWMGDISYRQAMNTEKLSIVGPTALTQNVSKWLKGSIFQGITPATKIVGASHDL